MTEIFGICSRVKYAQKGYPQTHFLLIDIDGDFKCLGGTLHWLVEHKIRVDFIVKTKHGWHIFCFQRFIFQSLMTIMPQIPNIDMKWVRIGLKRGYWFLWTRTAIIKPDGLARYVTFMKIRVPEENEWLRTKMGRFSDADKKMMHHQPFRVWHKNNLLFLLKVAEMYLPGELSKILDLYTDIRKGD